MPVLQLRTNSSNARIGTFYPLTKADVRYWIKRWPIAHVWA